MLCNYRLNGLQQLELMDAEYSPCDSFYFFLRICSMPLDAMPGVLSAIRALDDRDASAFARCLIAPERLPSDYLESLCPDDLCVLLRACLLVYTVMRSAIVPREFQLQASLESIHGCDSMVIAGTGHGKTLYIVIPMLLCPGTTTITMSPLKRLQMMQVCNWITRLR